MSQDKAVRWSKAFLDSIPDTTGYYRLTERQATALGAVITPMQWATRWDTSDREYIDQFSGETGDALMQPVDFCQLMADCIDAINETPYDQLTDGQKSLYKQLNQYLTKNSIKISGDGQSAPYNDEETITDFSSCDNDIVFGFAVQFVDLLDIVVSDAFQQIEQITNDGELLGLILEAIPITDLLGVDSLISFGDWIASTVAEDYEGTVTAQLKQEAACDIFCLITESPDCKIDFTVITNYLAGKAAVSFIPNDFESLVGLWVGSGWLNQEIVYGSWFLVASVLSYGSGWFNVASPDWLKTVVSAYKNDPNPDWAILCDPCATQWTETFDFTVSPSGWVKGALDGARWVSGTGWIVATRGLTGIEFDNGSSSFTVTSIEFNWSQPMSGNLNRSIISGTINPSTNVFFDVRDGNTTTVMVWSGNETIQRINLTIYENNSFSPPNPPSLAIVSATVSGVGTNPFI